MWIRRHPIASSCAPTPLLFIVLAAVVVLLVAVNRPLQALAGFGLVLLGLPAYVLFGRAKSRGAGGPTE